MITFIQNVFLVIYPNTWPHIITRGRKAPKSRFRLCFLLLLLLLFVFSVLQISCVITKLKLGLSLGTKVKRCCTIVSGWRSS